MLIGFITRFIPPQFYALALLGYGFVSAFAGGYAVKKYYQASLASVEKHLQEKRETNDGKAHENEIKVRSLPDGASSVQLFQNWSRAN